MESICEFVSNVIDILKSNIVASFALLISIINTIVLITNSRKKKTKITLDVDTQNSFYMDAIDTPRGNQESLVLSVHISNRSECPITISDVILKYTQESAHSDGNIQYPSCLPENPYSAIKDNAGNLDIISHTGDGYVRLDIKNNILSFPKRLEAYESMRGILLFVCAGSSSGDYTNVELEFITSRGTITKKIKVSSKEYNESRFM